MGSTLFLPCWQDTAFNVQTDKKEERAGCRFFYLLLPPNHPLRLFVLTPPNRHIDVSLVNIRQKSPEDSQGS